MISEYAGISRKKGGLFPICSGFFRTYSVTRNKWFIAVFATVSDDHAGFFRFSVKFIEGFCKLSPACRG